MVHRMKLASGLIGMWAVATAQASDVTASQASEAQINAAVARATEQPESGEAPVDLEGERDLEIRVEPMVWFPAMRGELSVGGGARFDVEALNLDEVEASPFGRFLLRSDDLVIDFNAFGVGISATEPARAPVDIGGTVAGAATPVSYDFDLTSFEITAGTRVWSVPVGVNDPDGGDESGIDVWFDAFVGARYFDVRADFATPIASSTDAQDLHGIVGIGLNMDLPEGFGFELTLDGGGGANGFSWDISVALGYEVVDDVAHG